MIVDAYNQFIRGYIVDPSKNPNGSPIGGIRTFINILTNWQERSSQIYLFLFGTVKAQNEEPWINYKGRTPRTIGPKLMDESEIIDNRVWQQMRVTSILIRPCDSVHGALVEADDVISYVKNSPMFSVKKSSFPRQRLYPAPRRQDYSSQANSKRISKQEQCCREVWHPSN